MEDKYQDSGIRIHSCHIYDIEDDTYTSIEEYCKQEYQENE